MRFIGTIWQLVTRAACVATLLAGMLLSSPSAQGQERGRPAVPAAPTPAPTGQPAPLPPAKLEEALRLLLKADSIATRRAPKEGGLESQGLVLDQALSKLGHDFYDQFYHQFEAPPGSTDYTIIITELPARANSVLVVIRVNNTDLEEIPLPTRTDQLEEVANAAVEMVTDFLRQAQNVSRQLETGHRTPLEVY